MCFDINYLYSYMICKRWQWPNVEAVIIYKYAYSLILEFGTLLWGLNEMADVQCIKMI